MSLRLSDFILRLIASGLCAALAAWTSPSLAQQYTYDTWAAVTDTLRGVERGRRTTLSRAFIVPGSVMVRVGDATLSPGDYVVNAHMGTLRIDVPLPSGVPVIVTFRRQPVMMSPVYALRQIETAPGVPDSTALGSSRAAALPSPPPPSATGRNLVLGGSKSVSFTVGSNQGTRLDQTLQATIEGDITPTIRVRALLSDNNLPIQPQGNTETLEYFDQVFVEIEGTRARAILGDFAYTSNISTFSPVTRQLKGVSASAWAPERGRLSAAGAAMKGEFRTREFRGISGLQGPYELLTVGRVQPEVIIAGTEKVYVNGERMQRGQNQDYTIDYETGSLRFTSLRLITRDTEIAVDYEVTQVRYARNGLFTSADQVDLGGGARLEVLFARQADDHDSPLNTTLSPEDQDVLAGAGDNPLDALTSGATPVEAGTGLYIQIPADTVRGIPAYFEFNDSIGDWTVEFVQVPAGGDYTLGGISNTGIRYFTFVPDSTGNYTVGRPLPLPERLSVVTGRVRRDTGKHLLFDLEWNVSDSDRNTFSALDDANNIGNAGRAKLALEKLPAPGGSLDLSGAFSLLEDRFTSFDRPRTPYFYRDWNLESVPLTGTERIGEGEVTYHAARETRLRYTLSSLSREGVTALRNEVNAATGNVSDRGVLVRAFDTDTEAAQEHRTRTHLTAQGSFGVAFVVPTFTFASERYHEDATIAPDSGQAYVLYRAALARRHPKGWVGRIEAEFRDTETIDPTTDEWRHARNDETYSGLIGKRGGGLLQGEMRVTHRIEDDDQLGATTSDLARLKATITSRGTGVRSDVDYEISQTAVRTLESSVVFVGEGNGDYNAQGDLVGKGKGAYMLVFYQTEETVPVNAVQANFRLVWSPRDVTRWQGGSGAWAWVRNNVSLDWTLGIVEETTRDPAWKVYLLIPSELQRNDATVFGTTSLRQDWHFFESVPNFRLTFRYRREDTENNRFAGQSEDRFTDEHILRASQSISARTTLTGEIGRTQNDRDGEGLTGVDGRAYETTGEWILAGVGWRLGAGSTIDVDARALQQKDAVGGAEQVVLTLTPRLVWRVGEKISVFGSYEYDGTRNRVVGSGQPIIWSNEGSGHRWSLAPTIRVARVISIVATYTGRNELTFTGARITDHELRMETRALF